MKKFLHIALQILVVACASTLATGQIRTVEKSEYDKINETSVSSGKLNRSVTVEYKQYRNQKMVSATKTVFTPESPERSSFVRFETRDGKTKRAFELIRFDGRRFERTNEGRWREIITKAGSGNGGGIGGGSGRAMSGPVEVKEVEQYAIGSVTLDKTKVTLYSLYRVYDLEKSLSFTDSRKYVDDAGRLIKEELAVSQIYPSNVTSVTVTTYDYDTENLKIEIPKSYEIEER